MAIKDIILDNVEMIPFSGCWIWYGSLTKGGYGRVMIDYSSDYVHRWAYRIFKGNIPNDLHIDHKCRVRSCCNPDHLELVTQKVNNLRGNSLNAQNARKTHCKNGHELSGNNVYYRKDRPNNRECRICRNDAAKVFHKNYRTAIDWSK